MSVRRVMLGLGAGAATVMALQTGALFSALGAPTTSDGRSYDPTKEVIQIGGVFAGYVTQMQGGFTSSDVASEKIGADYHVKKHIAGVKYEDFSFKTTANMSRAEWDWIRASENGEYQRKDGSFVIADSNMNAMRQVNFYSALITEIGFPALDAASKDVADLTVKFQPEEVKYLQGDGKTISAPAQSKMQKGWRAGNFKVSIDGLATTRVNKVDAFTFKQSVIQAAIGTLRDPAKMPAQMSTTNLKITMSDADAASVMTWVQQVNAPGANKASLAKNGTIFYLDPSMHELARTAFSGLLPVSVTAVPFDAKVDTVHRITLEMTVGKAILTPASDTPFD